MARFALVAVRRAVVAAFLVRELAAVLVRVLARLAVVVARFAVVVARFAVVVARLAVVVARRRVDDARDPVPRAASRACFVSPSIRFRTLLTSARVLAFFACDCSVLIAARAVLSASRNLRST